MEELLDDALQSLDKLKSSTAGTGAGGSASRSQGDREEMIMRFRTRGRSGSGSSARNLRYDSFPSSINILNFTPTKENSLAAGSGRSSPKIPSCLRRLSRTRPAPYELLPKRKPLNSLLNPPRVRSSDSYSEPKAKAFPEDSAFPPESGGGAGSISISAPKRSKSLEDLTESKSVRFALFYDDNSNSNEPDAQRFLNVLKGEANIKSEIDSMSMLIEKLDVA